MGARRSTTLGVLLAAVLGLAGCGDTDPSAGPPTTSAPEPTPVSALDQSWGDEAWLLRFTTASGPEGESVGAVYVRFTPATGSASVRTLPAGTERDTSGDAQALLVSADQKFVLLDAAVTAADRRRGRLTLYPLDQKGTLALDVRGWARTADLAPVAAAFDPVEPGVLRVVDDRRRVWRVTVEDRTAVRDGVLPQRSGWIYANGFDKNTGLPYIESIDTSDTLPPGNGDDDLRPVERRGGELRALDGADVPGQPPLPCGFSGGFTLTDGAAWIFCADTPKITAFRWSPGTEAWQSVGVASRAVVPATAVELPVVLPPVAVG